MSYDYRALVEDFAAAKEDFSLKIDEDEGWIQRWNRLTAIEQLMLHIVRKERRVDVTTKNP